MDEIEVIEKDELKSYRKRGYGHSHYEITEEDIKALREGKFLAFYDGEYTGSISLKKD